MRKAVATFYKFLDKSMYYFLIATMVLLVGLMTLQIGARVFSVTIMWTEECSRYLYIWLVFFGSAAVFEKGGHLIVDAILIYVPLKAKVVIDFIYHVVILAIVIIIAHYGFQYSETNMGRPFFSTKYLNLGVATLAIPLGCILMAINIVRNLYEMITQGSKYYEGKAGVM